MNIGPKLSVYIPSSNCNYESYMPNDNVFSLFLAPTCRVEISQVVKGLQNKGPGYDGMHAKIVKETHLHICHPLNYIATSSFRQGVSPKNLKLARVTPVFKENNCEVMANYRPVSVLPVFS